MSYIKSTSKLQEDVGYIHTLQVRGNSRERVQICRLFCQCSQCPLDLEINREEGMVLSIYVREGTKACLHPLRE
jgi:hypothetical protein